MTHPILSSLPLMISPPTGMSKVPLVEIGKMKMAVCPETSAAATSTEN